MREKYRFDLQDLLPIGVTLIVVGLVLAFGLQILGETKAEMCSTGYTFNSSSDSCYLDTNTSMITRTAQLNGTLDTITGVAKFPSKLPLIATVVVAVVIIGILIRYFTNK
jgi:hypothetical protein